MITNGVVAEASGKRSPERRAVRRMGRAHLSAVELLSFFKGGGTLSPAASPDPGGSPIAVGELASAGSCWAAAGRARWAGRGGEGRGGESRKEEGREEKRRGDQREGGQSEPPPG